MKVKKLNCLFKNNDSNHITKYKKEKKEIASIFYKNNYSMGNLNTTDFDIMGNQHAKHTNTFSNILQIDQKEQNVIKQVFKNTYDINKENEYFNSTSSNNFPRYTKNKKISNIKSRSIKPKSFLVDDINKEMYFNNIMPNAKLISNFDENYFKNLLAKEDSDQIINYNGPNQKTNIIDTFNKKHDYRKEKLLRKIKNFLASDTKPIKEFGKTFYKQSKSIYNSNDKKATNNIYEILYSIKNEIYKHFINNYDNISDYYDDWINYKNYKLNYNNNKEINVINEEIFYNYIHHRFNISIDSNKSKEIFNLILQERNIVNNNKCNYLDINDFKKIFFDKKHLIIKKNINNFYNEISSLSPSSKYEYLLKLINIEKIKLLNKTKEYNSEFNRDNDYNYDKKTFINLINTLLPKNSKQYFTNTIIELFEKFCNKINQKINIIFFIERIPRNINRNKLNKQNEDIKCNNTKNNILTVHNNHKEIIDINKTSKNFFRDYKSGVISLKKKNYRGHNIFRHQSKDRISSKKNGQDDKIVNNKMNSNIPSIKNQSLKKHSKNTDIIDFL